MREVLIVAVLSLVGLLLVQTFAFQSFFIPSGSMRDTLQVGDRVIVSKLTYRFRDVERGDVIVFGGTGGAGGFGDTLGDIGGAVGVGDREEDFIKRVVGLPGETISIRRNRVFIDGVPLEEPYRASGSRMRNMTEVVVPENHYFVMGDDRASSADSRDYGPIHRSQIIGRATMIVWPPGHWSGL